MNLDSWNQMVEASRELDMSSFKVKTELNSKFWDEDIRLKPEISKKLLEIAKSFFEDLDLDVKIDDITLTGSSANYNWSKYSDLDLHILVNYASVDENIDLVAEYFRGKISSWNNNHDIMMKDHEVEIYVQNTTEKHVSSGVYSILNEEWVVKPSYVEPKIDNQGVKNKALKIMDIIDSIKELYDEKKYEDAYTISGLMKEKIRKFRKCGLDLGGEYSTENLAFKLLRRNDYLGELRDIRNQSYDKMMSIRENFAKNWSIFKERVK